MAGALSAQDNVAIPMKIHDAASVRCVFAYVQTVTTDGQSAYVVKYSTDGGATWNVLEKMGIAQMLPDGAKTTYDFLVGQGYGKPETRRLPYADYGLVSTDAITGSGSVQTIATASYDGSTTGLEVGRFVFFDLDGATEECVEVLAVDPEAQTFDAVVTKRPSGVRDPAVRVADADPQRGKRPGVRYQSGCLAESGLGFDCRDSDVKWSGWTRERPKAALRRTTANMTGKSSIGPSA